MAENHLNEVRIPKTTGTYADVLRAVGIATLIEEIQGQNLAVTIADHGSEYVVTPIQPLDLEGKVFKLTVGYPYLAHKRAKPAPTNIFPAPYAYVSEMAKDKQWQKRRSVSFVAGKGRWKTGEQLAEEGLRPESRFTLMKAINSLRSNSEAWNQLAHRLQDQIEVKAEQFSSTVVKRMQMIPVEIPELDGASAILQAFMPTAGKGINRPKPDAATLTNPKKPWADWFWEWCKYRAVWPVLNASFTGKGGKDLKFVALLPGTQVELSALRNIADEFAAGRWVSTGRAYTNVKSDIFVLLGLARWLVEHSEFCPVAEQRLFHFLKSQKPREARPRDIVKGIATAYFKSLGTGRALANVGSILLPDWFPITTTTYEHWLSVLDEHARVMKLLDEEKAEEASLLALYRECISSNDFALYLVFFADYACHLMRRIGLGYVEQFTVSNLEVLVMGLNQDSGPHVAGLVKDSAFLALADAVHEATVKAQYWKGQNQQEYDIHYGLAQQWKRAADQGIEFVHVLSDFVRAYNEENAKRREKGKWARMDVARSDLDHVLECITDGKLDTRTVCLLLLAYGFAMTDDERQRTLAARQKNRSSAAVSPPVA